jgi:hypothetical protein
MASGADPVGFGLVKSLSHPGGNVTGLTNFAEELASKQMDVMREMLPSLSRVAVLINIANSLHVPQWRETQAAAAQAAIALVPFEIRNADQLEEAFATFTRERADALLIPPDVTFAHSSAPHHKSRARCAAADNLYHPPSGSGRRLDELWPESAREFSPRGNLRAQDTQRLKAARPSRREAHQHRTCHQSEDR